MTHKNSAGSINSLKSLSLFSEFRKFPAVYMDATKWAHH